MPEDAFSDWPQSSKILLDHIRALRNPESSPDLSQIASQDVAQPDVFIPPTESPPRVDAAVRKASGASHSSQSSISVQGTGVVSRPPTAAENPLLTAKMSSKSSISSVPGDMRTTQSPTPPSEASFAGPLDTTALSVDSDASRATTVSLTKEKQALTSRNAQLWKLVEKQRTMILGLNQDLEKAVKEREKYRKRLKEKEKIIMALTNSALTTPSTGVKQPGMISPTALESEAAEDQQSKMSQKSSTDQDRADVALPLKDRSPSPIVFDTIPTSSSELSTAISNDQQPNSKNLPRTLPLRVQETKINRGQSDNSKFTVVGSPGEGKRKGPPQPLDLAQTQKTGKTAVVEDVVDSASDYENASSPIERGRRRTRADDDREREATYEEEDGRSKSSKSSQSKSKAKSKKGPDATAVEYEPETLEILEQGAKPSTGFENNVGLPASPRAALLGGLQSPLQPSQQSISSILRQADRNLPKPLAANRTQTETLEMPLKSPGLPLKSPGLPMSPRPGDRPMHAPAPRLPNQQLAGPGPMSPRSAMVLSPRAPRQPIPLPQHSSLVVTSPPHVANTEQTPQHHSPQQSLSEQSHLQETNHTSSGDIWSDPANLDQVNRSLVSDQYPELLLPPNALPLVEVRVDSSRLRPSRNGYMTGKTGEEDLIFTLAVHSRSDNAQLWRLEKSIMSLPSIDQSLRKSSDFNTKLPEKNLFIGHAPAKVDSRRDALGQYFAAALDTPLDESSALALCDFLSTDVIGPRGRSSIQSGSPTLKPGERRRKEGYLAKKGKQLGGWKARYFVLDKAELRYFEGPNGGHLGTVRLHKAQIAKQNAEETSDDAEYRHAFMILEPKRRDSSSLIRHVLCAESDQERDGWVEALIGHIEGGVDEVKFRAVKPPPIDANADASKQGSQNHSASGSLHSFKHEQTIGTDGQTFGSPTTRSSENSSPAETFSEFGTPSVLQHVDRPNISGPVAGGPIQNSQAWGNKSPTLKDSDYRKRNIFGFKPRISEESPQYLQSQSQTPKRSRGNSQNRQVTPGSHNGRAVFGISLSDAAEFFAPHGVDICLPSPVYRCIEYLEAKNAWNEEGIFRTSGSNLVIKQIKERFNTEGDVKLLESPNYDINAVASLLKLYLRELPESVLTRELHLDFLRILDYEDRKQKTDAVNVLVHRLPEANFELLATLSRFLIDIVSNSDVNLMHIRNLGIVFSPTLNIPAPLISLFVTDHESIFGNAVDASSSPIINSLDSASSSPKSTPATTGEFDLRSPRKQMFTDLGSPGYTQTTFGSQSNADPNNVQQQQPSSTSTNTTGSQSTPRHNDSNLAVAPPQPRAAPRPIQQVNPDAGAFGSLNAALASSVTPYQPVPAENGSS